MSQASWEQRAAGIDRHLDAWHYVIVCKQIQHMQVASIGCTGVGSTWLRNASFTAHVSVLVSPGKRNSLSSSLEL